MRVKGSRWNVVVSRTRNEQLVEVWFVPSGIIPRALIGGVLDRSGAELNVEFDPALSQDAAMAPRRKSRSEFGDFAGSLSTEYRAAIGAGLLDAARDSGLAGGVFRITAAGEDPVNSSEMSFRTSSYILGCVLVSESELSKDELFVAELAARASVEAAYGHRSEL